MESKMSLLRKTRGDPGGDGKGAGKVMWVSAIAAVMVNLYWPVCGIFVLRVCGAEFDEAFKISAGPHTSGWMMKGLFSAKQRDSMDSVLHVPH